MKEGPIHGCSGKVPIHNKKTARRRAKSIGERGGRVVAYRCRNCHSWHIGGFEGHGQYQQVKDHRKAKRDLLAEQGDA